VSGKFEQRRDPVASGATSHSPPSPESAMSVDFPPYHDGSTGGPPGSLTNLVNHYPQGVCLLTFRNAADAPVAHRVLAFLQISEHPPRVGVIIHATSAALDGMKSAFGINILSARQAELYRAVLHGNELDQGEWRLTSTGVPVLSQAVAWIDAEIESVKEIANGLELVISKVRSHGESSATPLVAVLGGHGELRTSTISAVDDDLTESLRIVDRVHPEMESLAADLTARVTATAYINGELVFLASAGHLEQHVGPGVPIGFRIPAVAPFGATFMAWAPSDEVEQWLTVVDRASNPQSARERALGNLAAVRSRGFTVYLRTATHDPLWANLSQGLLPTTLEELSDDDFALLNSLRQDPVDFGPEDVHEVEWIAVPVFGPTSEVVLALGVEGLPHARDWTEFEARLARLEQAASNSIAILGGRVPVHEGGVGIGRD
jgi:flavin reductase (DIM6/NTAB) family NADH-FMN oxidoreductase RutF/DNA-binding IclR family transcriptional regulator